jgi:hypothetical protein
MDLKQPSHQSLMIPELDRTRVEQSAIRLKPVLDPFDLVAMDTR